MNFKLAAVTALAVFASAGAVAATTSWADHANPTELALVGFGAGVVQDKFTFTLGATYDVTSNAQSFGFTPGFAFYGLFDSADTSLGAYTFNAGPQTVTLGAGSYYYSVLGSSSTGGSYALASTIATPVPEPETLAMMLAGLGAVGFLARRRQG